MAYISTCLGLAGLIGALSVSGNVAHAEGVDSLSYNINLEEVTVTASRIQLLKHELPASVSILGKRLLDQTQFLSIKDLGGYVPNVHLPDFGSSLSTPIYIRGIGSRRINMVGLYADGIPLLEGGSIDADYTDLRSIEILRGPQGTLYGRGAMGGVINLRSHRPLETQFTQVNLLGGNYGLFGINAQSYQKVHDGLGLAASINYLHRGGYHTNEYTHRKADKLNSTSAKVALQYRRNGWDIYGFAQYQHRYQGGYPYGLLDKNNVLGPVSYDSPASYRRQIFVSGLSVQKRFASDLIFKSATGYQHLDDEMMIDQDFSPHPQITVLQKTQKNIWTEELTVSRSRGRYSWVTGLYGYAIGSDKTLDKDTDIRPRDFSHVFISYGEPGYGLALFHQSRYQITDRLTAELGVRYDWDRRRQEYANLSTNKLSNKSTKVERPVRAIDRQFTPKIALSYRLGQEHRVYASAQRGYQPGGFNVQFDRPEEQSYKPEYSWNYELGTHLYFLDGKLQVDGAIFYIDWEQQQVQQAIQSLRGSKMTNAGRSRSLGAELAAAYSPISGLNVSASYGYTKATFVSYAEFVSRQGNVSRAGNYIPHVPRSTFSAAVDYTLPMGLDWLDDVRLAVQYRGIGEIYWDSANMQKHDAYSLLDAQISFRYKYCTLELWGRNLLDKEYRTYQFTLQQGRNFAQRGAPRHFGATLRFKL